MKYGQNFENESVPEWSIHNIDYNTLKHSIKVNTKRGSGAAIAIPGQQDNALRRFEDGLYHELCEQHGRVGLFVSNKADEITYRLQHLSGQVHRFVQRCTASSRARLTQKRQRRFAKYESDIVQCRDELRALSRFISAQVVAFRKILKKYKKWTGSSALTSRFRENVLSDPKSFTRRDFVTLETECEELLSKLRAASPVESESNSPLDSPVTLSRQRRTPAPMGGAQVLPEPYVQTQYWNEYDDGSEAGDVDGGYVIYLHPDEESKITGTRILGWFSMPLTKAKAWVAGHHDAERDPLLPTSAQHDVEEGYGATTTAAPGSYFSSPPGAFVSSGHATDTEGGDDDDEEAFASGDNDFPPGYDTYYAAMPSVDDQKMARYREKVLFWATIGSFAASFVMTGVAAILITTGRHKLRVEVDAGATVGIVASLACACAALGLTVTRREGLGVVNGVVVGVTFLTTCVLNGMLLVLIMGNTAL